MLYVRGEPQPLPSETIKVRIRRTLGRRIVTAGVPDAIVRLGELLFASRERCETPPARDERRRVEEDGNVAATFGCEQNRRLDGESIGLNTTPVVVQLEGGSETKALVSIKIERRDARHFPAPGGPGRCRIRG